MEHPVIAVRNTELEDFKACRRKYLYTWVRHLRPKRTDDKLVLGTLVHRFLETFENGMNNNFPPHIIHAGANAAMEEIWNNHYATIGELDTEGLAKAEKLWDMATGICNNFVEWRPKLDLSPVILAEDKFETPIGGIMGVRVILKGTRDGISRPTADEYFLREYKTCKSIKDKLKQYTLDKQTRRYMLAALKEDIPLVGVELVLIAKMLPLVAENMLIKSPKDGITRDKKKWNRMTYEEALRVPTLGKFVEEGSKNGLTEQGFHDILRVLKERDNPFFRLERIYFGPVELAQVSRETLAEAWTIHQTKELSETLGDDIYFRSQGIMGMNCKSCSFKEVCEMDFKGLDSSLLLQEHYEVVDPATVEVDDSGEDEDDEDDLGS